MAAKDDAPETLPMDGQQQVVYEEAKTYLDRPVSQFLAPTFSVVSVPEGLPDHIREDTAATTASATHTAAASSSSSSSSSPDTAQPNRSFRFNRLVPVDLSPLRGEASALPAPLQRAVNDLVGIEKKEQSMVSRSQLTKELTGLLLQKRYTDAAAALEDLTLAGQAVPRRVCQHPFRKNDIVWVCRTCQADETCVLCHSCFSQSDHTGHDVNFYHAQAGGCCDCGDPDAWDPQGFCPHHGPNATGASERAQEALPPNLVHRVRGVIPAVVDWIVENIAVTAHVAYQRANPRHPESSASRRNSDVMEEEHESSPMDMSVRSRAGSDRMDVDEDNDDEISVNELDFPTTNPNLTTPPRPHVFSPSVASASRSFREGAQQPHDNSHHARNTQIAESLGQVGSKGRGLFLVLHSDEIHLSHDVVDALQFFWGPRAFLSDHLVAKIEKALRLYGQLIIWGTAEICNEIGATQAHLWMDGDKVVCARVGDLMLERTSRLSRHGMFCSILTYDELLMEERSVAVVQWLSAVARSCDPLCQSVAESILPNRHLVPLLRADFKMSSRVTKAWYSLLLTLLAVPAFKSHLAAAYCDTYRAVTAKYARGMGVLERSGYTLSVQFLNRVAYVVDLVKSRDLLGKLGKSLLDTLRVATRVRHFNGRLDPNHFVLAHRRYSPCVSDLKCVLNVAGMPRITACSGGTFLGDWLEALSVVQFMDPQTWRHWAQGHVEDETRGWVGAFNASISLGSLFERLLSWKDEEESPIKDTDSPLSKNLLSCVEFTFHILLYGVAPWQRREASWYQPTPSISAVVPHRRSSSSLAFSTVSAKCGTALAMEQIPLSQISPFSFHLPLHRFVASSLRELCLRTNDVDAGVSKLLGMIRDGTPPLEARDLFVGLMEYPVLVLSRVSQVRADLWKRNGPGLTDQVLNYAEPPFCRNMRDADMLVTQFSVVGRQAHLRCDERPSSDVGAAFLVNLLIHRLGLFDFLGFSLAPNTNLEQYREEIRQNLYPAEVVLPGEGEPPLPWTYSAARDPPNFMKLVEEFLNFIVVFVSELPHAVPKSRDEQTNQAKHRLFREVVHRLASGPKTHSELSEVHHVLSHWDNVLLNEQGRLLNPDDATGASLGVVLEEVAERRVVRSGRPEPDKWELKKTAWDSYDPAFYHISQRSHQTAAENRPKPKVNETNGYGWDTKPFAPRPLEAHPFFARLRRDMTTDAAVMSVCYKVLHIHCRQGATRSLVDLHGKILYESEEKSETTLARTIHLLTLGAYAWSEARGDDADWRTNGGGSPGSVFFDRGDVFPSPTATEWISAFLLRRPDELLDSRWHAEEDNMLLLLHRLAVKGGGNGGFSAQDNCLRCGAAWLCKFAAEHNADAASMMSLPKEAKALSVGNESEAEKRKRMAKERQQKIMENMRARAAKFASALDDDEKLVPRTPDRPIRAGSFGSLMSSGSSAAADESDGQTTAFAMLASDVDNIELVNVPPRLMQTRPRCIICNDEESLDEKDTDQAPQDDGERSRKKSRRKTENALGFVGYSQASTVLKGGGGPPPPLQSPTTSQSRFVGVHVALCGHAVHSECFESYLATVFHREDRLHDRPIGKREEFRCPLCQRLSNSLVPFIDVGVDWVDTPTCQPLSDAGSDMIDSRTPSEAVESLIGIKPLGVFLAKTPWWSTNRDGILSWDGHSTFMSSEPDEALQHTDRDSSSKQKNPRRLQPLKKKDLYAAWNAMMRTRRFVRRKLRPRSFSGKDSEISAIDDLSAHESSGEPLVLRRFMDQVSDISFRADGRRLGEDNFRDLFGEFRHVLTERSVYSGSGTSDDWPGCMYTSQVPESRKQEFSREKLVSKLLLSIQAFAYSACCEGFEARRAYASIRQENGNADDTETKLSSIRSKFGIRTIDCCNTRILLPEPTSSGDGLQPFDGRIGKLRYLALSLISAAGALSLDLIQLALQFPTEVKDSINPCRASVAYPLLCGNVLAHITIAICAVCGSYRAKSDSIDVWQSPADASVSTEFEIPMGLSKQVDKILCDCLGFMKLGFLARTLQALLGGLGHTVLAKRNSAEYLASMKRMLVEKSPFLPRDEKEWSESCLRLLEVALQGVQDGEQEDTVEVADPAALSKACSVAAEAAISFLADTSLIVQLFVPGAAVFFDGATESFPLGEVNETSRFKLVEAYRLGFGFESISSMLESEHVCQVVKSWYDGAYQASSWKAESGEQPIVQYERSSRLRKSFDFHAADWPSTGCGNMATRLSLSSDQKQTSPASTCQVQTEKQQSGRIIVTFSSKKSVPLLGGFEPGAEDVKPRVAVVPTSYTDLYAELGALLPDCEQTAVCLICGEVLNSGGKGECTRHSYRCGAGAGMFFLLQECTGLIVHKSKAAYIHSPYVDSHGETPQYRGRPLNLDLNRYDHLREIWYGHGVRQQVLTERANSRRLLMPEY